MFAIVILLLVISYCLVVFFFSRFFVPHLGFRLEPVPNNLPSEMVTVINQLKSKAKSQSEFLKLAHDYIGSEYRSERFNTVLNLVIYLKI